MSRTPETSMSNTSTGGDHSRAARPQERVSIISLTIGILCLVAMTLGTSEAASQATSLPEMRSDGATSNTVCGTWNIVSSPSPGFGGNTLVDVAVVSANNVWAVGYYDNGDPDLNRTLIQHWNGSTWSVVPSPNVGSGRNSLSGVAVVSENDIWAVGGYFNNSNGQAQTLIEHWNGSTWSVVPSPNVGSGGNNLNDVTAVSANDVWAVGYAESGQQTLIEHWDGSTWSVVPSPNAGSGFTSLNSVAVVAANDVWAVGYFRNGANVDQTLVEHWNGSTWSIVPSPSPGSVRNILFGIAVVAANDVWAVGDYGSGGARQTLVEHWDGSTWSVVPSPNSGSGDNVLWNVAVVAANDVWAVGFYVNNSVQQTLTQHWDGNTWSVVPSPNSGSVGNRLLGVAAVSANDVWAVGALGDPTGFSQTLIERYTGACVTPTASPPVPTTTTPTNTPSSTPVPPSSTPVPSATAMPVQFSDVPPDHPFYTQIMCLVNRGIMSGYSDGTFRPGNNVTRGQLSKIVSGAAGYQEDPGPQMFTDVTPDSTFYVWIQRLALRGHIGGYVCGSEGEPCDSQNRPYFRPGNNATRGQISKIVSNAAGFNEQPSNQTYTDVPAAHPFYLFIERLTLHGVMSGYQCGGAGEPCDNQNRAYFRPGNNATRGQTSKIVANTFFPGCQAR